MRERGVTAKVSLCTVIFAIACSDGAPKIDTFELPDGDSGFRGTTSKAALSPAELRTYISDRQYIRSLAPRGTAVGINHADPRQHRFALSRMRMAGKTPENSPQLFKMMRDQRFAHQTRGLVAGMLAPAAATAEGHESQHVALTTGVSPEAHTMLSGAIASRKDSLFYGFFDSCTWDEAGEPLSECEFVEVFGNLTYAAAQATGDLTIAQGSTVEGDSFLSETVAGTDELHQSYVIAQAAEITPQNSLVLPTIVHPRDGDGDGAIVICLQRAGAACDYDNLGVLKLKLPLKGSISVDPASTGTFIDWQTIVNQYQTAAGPSPGNVYVTLGNNGGGCRLPPGGVGMTMRTFWQKVTVSPTVDPTTMHWDLSNPADWAMFHENCQLVQATAFVTMDLVVPYLNKITGERGALPFTISNAVLPRPLTPPSLQFQPAFRITNSCLAAGTLVAMSGSAARKIEDLHIGDQVVSPYALGLTITDTIVGTESAQMVRIADGRGRELLMTEMHPLFVVDRGMVPAKFIRVGDRVKTDDGTSELVRVTRESYAGKVYNLAVGTPEESRALGVDQTAMYANGFLVGDSRVQGKYEALDVQAAAAAASPKALPASWRTDYLTSRSRAASAQR